MTDNSIGYSENVAVEAGMVADVDTGQVRSVWMERHRGMLEERMKTQQVVRKRRTRVAKALWCVALGALTVCPTIFFATSDEVRQIAGAVWSSLGKM